MQSKSKQTNVLAGQGQDYFRLNNGVWNGLRRFGGKVRTGGVDDSSAVPQACVDVPVGVSLGRLVAFMVVWMDVFVVLGAASSVLAGLFMLGYAVLSVADVRHSGLDVVAVVSTSWSWFVVALVNLYEFIGCLTVIFTVNPLGFISLISIVTARVVSIAISEFVRPSTTRLVPVHRVVVAVAAVGGFSAYLYFFSSLRVNWILQLSLFVCAEVWQRQDATVFFGLAFATLFIRPPAVVGFVVVYYMTRRQRVYRGKVTATVSVMNGAEGDLVRKIAGITGLQCMRMFEYASLDEWTSFGIKGRPDTLRQKLSAIAFVGDRDMSCVLGRVGLRNDWKVGHMSNASQQLLTNAAFTRYFHAKLSGLFPNMRDSAEDRIGTFVEALVGIAVVQSKESAQLERFIFHEVASVVGINYDRIK